MESLIFLFIGGIFVVCFVLPIVAIVKVSGLEHRIRSLEGDIRRLRINVPSVNTSAEQKVAERHAQIANDLSRLHETAEQPKVDRIEHVTDETVIRAYEDLEAAKRKEQNTNDVASLHTGWYESTERPERAPEPPTRAGRSMGEWEELIGGNLFNRIGAIALLIGVAFLAKYGYDHSWISRQMAVIFGFICGAGMVVAGDRIYKSGAQIFAQGLIGAGISILYLSAYSSCNLYHIIGQGPALALMCLVTAAAFFQAIRTDSLVVALLGLAGGFLTPILLGGGSGGGNGVELFAYIAVLDAGLLALTIKKDNWVAIEPLALAATYLIYLGWYAQSYHHGSVAIPVVFLTIFWAMFHGLDIYRSLKSINTYSEIRMGEAVVNSLAYYWAMFTLINPLSERWMALTSILIALVYFISLMIMLRRHADKLSVVPRYSVTAITLSVAATAIQFHNQSFLMVGLWSLEALAFVLCGQRFAMRYVWGCGVALFAVAAAKLFLSDGAFCCVPIKGFIPVWNARFGAFVTVAASSAVSATLLARSIDTAAKSAAKYLNYAWPTLLFILIGLETNDFFSKLALHKPQLMSHSDLNMIKIFALGMVWAAYAVILTWHGLRKRLDPVACIGMAGMAIAAAVVAVEGASFEPGKAFTLICCAAAFAFVIAGLFIQKKLLARPREDFELSWSIAGAVPVLGIMLGFELITVQWLGHLTVLHLRDADVYLGMRTDLTRMLVLAGLWAIYANSITWLGFAKKSMDYIISGAVILALAVLTVAFIGYDYQPVSHYITLFNLRAGAFAVVAISMLAWYAMLSKRTDEYTWAEKGKGILQVAISLLIFELLSVELWTALSIGDKTGSLRQMGISVAWVIYSILLMGYGIWRRMRTLRFVAIALFELSILKVFLYDLSSLETVYRIFSFIGLGLFLLATSYLYQRFKGFIIEDQ